MESGAVRKKGERMSRVLIVGGGASGMLAAVFAARKGHSVQVFEKNEKLGKKVYITGKGRCNITNECDMDTLFANVVGNPKFLYSAFYGFNNYDMMDFLEELGLKLKTERGGRVFPVSDKASDVIFTLQREMQRLGVKVYLHTKVEDILAEQDRCVGIKLANRQTVKGDAVLIATGGLSYPATGSTGDGYRFAQKLGHHVSQLEPGLVPFVAKEAWVKELQGISLKNIQVTILYGKKPVYTEFGEMLFTHFGVSGPVILRASSLVKDAMKKGELILSIDLKAALQKEQLEVRLLREFEANQNKQIKNVMDTLLPRKMVSVVLNYMGISEEKKVHAITKAERGVIIDSLKDFRLTLTGYRGFSEAIITQGGVNVSEILPSSMESRIVKGVYFIGEVLDLDALTGGFNLQIAWSTAYAAANSL